jgi:hypothetical protein
VNSDLLVIAGASAEHGTLPEYRRQLAAAGIDLHMADISDRPNMNGGGNLGFRVRVFERLARQFAHVPFLIFSDAFDVLFFGSMESVIARIPPTHLLHAAEKNCYPDLAMANRIADTGPWRFANGGLVAGTPQSFLAWCEAAPRHPAYNPEMLDQQFLNILVSEDSPLCVLDSRTELFMCLYGGYEELNFANGEPVNTLYGTWPSFIHCNGNWESATMWDNWRISLL